MSKPLFPQLQNRTAKPKPLKKSPPPNPLHLSPRPDQAAGKLLSPVTTKPLPRSQDYYAQFKNPSPPLVASSPTTQIQVLSLLKNAPSLSPRPNPVLLRPVSPRTSTSPLVQAARIAVAQATSAPTPPMAAEPLPSRI